MAHNVNVSSTHRILKHPAPNDNNSKLAEDNAELRLDKDRLLGVVRRHKEAGRADSVAAHRDRIRKRNMSEKEVR